MHLDQAIPEAIMDVLAPITHKFSFLFKLMGTEFLTTIFDLEDLLI